ncbi:hypothetical protein DFH94DRAFT_346354 [Russula ochroleuca]|uniref:Uncharacterized protein n=1 Tax=Russula ochroleuca TaxID=152965 RepID=A0A9P5JUX5_9AGAM|nr:hypothetical protein DFH94DRAFT_346354 [Russula ochroleuca]
MASSMNIDTILCDASNQRRRQGRQGLLERCSPAFANTLRILLGCQAHVMSRVKIFPTQRISFSTRRAPCGEFGISGRGWMNPALIFGTTNQTPYVASIIPDPAMRLYEHDERSLLARIPDMYAFQNDRCCLFRVIRFCNVHCLTVLGHILYTTWQHKIEQASNVTLLLGYVVTRVASRTKQRNVL